MSVSKWAYEENWCGDRSCVGDCDLCRELPDCDDNICEQEDRDDYSGMRMVESHLYY